MRPLRSAVLMLSAIPIVALSARAQSSGASVSLCPIPPVGGAPVVCQRVSPRAADPAGEGIAMLRMAASLADARRDADAVTMYQEAARLLPDSAAPHLGLARALERLGRRDDALAEYRAYAVVSERQHVGELDAPPRTSAMPDERPVSVSSAPSRRAGVYTGPSSSGSGFAVSRAGLVLTNKHVVRGCSTVQLRVGAEERRLAAVVALDADDDLALLKVSGTLPSVVRFRSGSTPRPGDDVVAAGYPLNGLLADEVNVTVGYISALAGLHNDQHELQMTAPVQPGSSGGPLFDASANLVGVVVTKLNARLVAETTGDLPQNVNFAIKGTVAREFLEQNGVRVETGATGAPRSHADIGDVGRQVTMLVECYK